MVTTESAIGAEGERLAAEVEADPARLDAVITAAGPERISENAREGALAALKILAVRRPELVLARWATLLDYLASGNAFTQMATAHVVARLAPAADPELVRDAVVRLRPLLGDKVSVAAHTLMALGDIGRGCPGAKSEIVAAVLDLDRVAISNRLGNLRGYGIETLDAVVPESERSQEIIAFVARGLDEDSPRTRKVAKETLSKWGTLARH